MKFSIGLLLVLIGLSGCTTVAEHRRAIEDGNSNLTVGLVQGKIQRGMSGAEVASVLGSPNIVTSGGLDQEAWVYDRISTQSVYSNSSGGVNALIFGPAGSAGGGMGAGYSGSTGAATMTQKTLTVIINFKDGKVENFAYHASKF